MTPATVAPIARRPSTRTPAEFPRYPHVSARKIDTKTIDIRWTCPKNWLEERTEGGFRTHKKNMVAAQLTMNPRILATKGNVLGFILTAGAATLNPSTSKELTPLLPS